MAIDPTEVAQQQDAARRASSVGSPTEFAKGPEQEGIQVAGAGKLFDLINKLESSVSAPKRGVRAAPAPDAAAPDAPAVDPTVAPRMPTPQEAGLVPDVGAFSPSATKRALAPKVLSPEGVAEFERRNLIAPGVDQKPPTDILQDAQTALADEAIDDAALSATNVAEDAQSALNAEIRGFKTTTGIAPEEKSQAVLDRLDVKEKNIQSLKDGGDFNFDYIDTADDVKAIITAVGDTYRSETAAAKRGVRSNKKTTEAATEILLDEIGYTKKLLDRQIGDGAMTAEMFVAGRELLVKSASKLNEMALSIKNGSATDADRLRFRRQLAIHNGIQMQLKGAQAEAARALQSFQIRVDGELDAERFGQEATRLLSESGEDGVTDLLASNLLRAIDAAPEGDALKAANKFSEIGAYAKFKQSVHEAYLAGLLSSPATQMKNIVGTASFMLFQLPTEVISGLYGSVVRTGRKGLGKEISEDQAYMEDALFRLKGWSDAYRDAMEAASIAWRTETPSGSSKLDVEQYAAVSGGDSSFFGKALTQIGRRMRIPFRLLLSADEFTKTISQRGEFYTSLHKRYQHALRQGKTQQEALDEAGMMMLDPSSVAGDLDVKAKFDTLQSDLGLYGDLTGRLQRTLAGRYILPFATAPTNAMLRTMEYVPFAPSKNYYDLTGKNGPRAQQLAMGRWTLGGAVFMQTNKLALDGKITGGMPSDEESRDALPQGWQPYSIVKKGEGFPEGKPLYDPFGVPNGPLLYISYAGFEPVGGILAISADTAQRMTESNDPDSWLAFAQAATYATMGYYRELPMLQGINDVITGVEKLTEEKGQEAIEGLARSYAESATIAGVPNPLSSLQRMFARLADPTQVKPKGDIDYYTIEDVETLLVDDEGKKYFAIAKPDGTPDYKKVGQPKKGAESFFQLMQHMNQLQAKDSFIRDERDYNAVVYDTYGIAKKSDEFSLANNPAAALFGNLTGVRLKKGEELEDYEKELIRLHTMTDKWPLSNPEKIGPIKLTYGMQSDLVSMAKNKVELYRQGYGKLDFRSTINALVSSREYRNTPDEVRVTLLRQVNQQFIDAGFQALLEFPEYANMRQAYEQVKQLKESGRR